MFTNKLISIVSTCGLLFLFSPTAFGEILFQENFDNVNDWQSAQTKSKACGGTDVITFADTCTIDCPPPATFSEEKTFSASYYAGSVYCDNAGNQLYMVNNDDPRGGTGKSLKNWAEVGASPNWTGGRILQSVSPRNDLYVSLYLKYPAGFTWSDGTDHGYQKVISVSSYPEIDSKTSGQIFGRGSAYWNGPDFIWQHYTNISFNAFDESQINPEPRGVPGYINIDDVDNVGLLVSDGQWHHIQVRLRLNSAPGIADGVYEMWVDEKLLHTTNKLIWIDKKAWSPSTPYDSSLSTNSIIPTSENKGFRCLSKHISGKTEPKWANATTFGDIVTDENGNQWQYFTDFKWNTVWLLDNIYIGKTGKSEQALYVDDIVVSTEYVSDNLLNVQIILDKPILP